MELKKLEQTSKKILEGPALSNVPRVQSGAEHLEVEL